MSISFLKFGWFLFWRFIIIIKHSLGKKIQHACITGTCLYHGWGYTAVTNHYQQRNSKTSGSQSNMRCFPCLLHVLWRRCRICSVLSPLRDFKFFLSLWQRGRKLEGPSWTISCSSLEVTRITSSHSWCTWGSHRALPNSKTPTVSRLPFPQRENWGKVVNWLLYWS